MTTSLRRTLGALEYFTFGFGSMVGVGWLVIMDDWLGRGGPRGGFVSVLLVAQIVPYFMTGFESIPKASEEARPDLGPHTLSRAITAAVLAGGLFYVLVVGVVAWATRCSCPSRKWDPRSRGSAGAPPVWHSSRWRAAVPIAAAP